MKTGNDEANPLTAAVIGGGMGGGLSLRALAASPRFEVVALADMRQEACERWQEEIPGLRTFDSHESLFRECPVDVVCVSTYPPTHEPVTLDALHALPNVRGLLVEKPLGHTAASGRSIIDALIARNLPVVVPHNLRTLPTPLEIIHRVLNGDIGSLRLVEIECRGWDIINAGIHWLDFFVALIPNDPIAHVLAQCDKTTRTFRDGMQVETIAVTSVQTQSGVRCVLHTGDDTHVSAPGKDTAFRIVGDKGVIEFYGWEAGYRVNGETMTPAPFAITGHRRHLETLADQIATGKTDYTAAQDSLSALEICEAAYLSARHDCRIVFPFSDFTPPAPNDWGPGQPYSGQGGGRDGRKL